jgi:hypothetical protein
MYTYIFKKKKKKAKGEFLKKTKKEEENWGVAMLTFLSIYFLARLKSN